MRRLTALIALTLILPATASAAPSKLSDRLQRVLEPGAARGSQAAQSRRLGLPEEGGGSLSRRGDAYVTEIRTRGTAPALVARLRGAGAHVLHVSSRYDTVTAAIGRGDLEAVAGVAGVSAVDEVLRPEVGQVGSGTGGEAGRRVGCADRTISEGDTQLRAAVARATYGVDGSGVKVGVLSDSFDTAKDGISPPVTTPADDVASGDLPGAANPCGLTTPVEVLQDDTDADADEGRAMLQIVHDVAPGAQLSFATAFISETSFADNIIALKNAGAKVIVDDIIYGAEPFYQDGVIANAVSQVTDAGVAYFSMAFNNEQRLGSADVGSWEASSFRSTTCPAAVSAAANFPAGSTCMDFDPGAGDDPAFDIGVSGAGTVPGRLNIDLQWAEAAGAVGTDYDLWILYDNTVVPGVYSLNTNATSERPFEFAGVQGGDTSVKRQVVISRRPGGASPRLKFVIQNNGYPITSFEYPTGGGIDTVGPTIYGHNGTAKAQTVGAISYLSSTAPESFSGRGPVTHYFGPVGGSAAAALGTPEVLSKPDVTATDRGANTFFGYLDGAIHRFSGTSAAAPHAAAVAALQLQEAPGLSPATVKANQKASAKPIGAFGPLAIGAGLVDAAGAIAADPLTVAATAPAAPVTDRFAPIAFSANHRSATFTCALDGGTAAACTSPYLPASPLGDGAHTLVVNATDASGATGSASAAFAVTPPPDTTPPPASDPGTASGISSGTTPGTMPGAAPGAMPGATPGTSPSTVKRCVVPKLKGKTRSKARKALKKANCKLGKVKGKKGGKVKTQTRKAGTVIAAGSEIGVRLRRKR